MTFNKASHTQLLAQIVHAQATASAANSIGAHVRVSLPLLWPVLEFHTRTMCMPLTLEFYTCMMLCLSRWSSTLMQRYAPHAGVTLA